MIFFHHEETSNPSKRCKFLTSTLKGAFSNCRRLRGRFSSSSPEEEDDDDDSTSDVDDEQEGFVSAVISKYQEAKRRRKASLTMESLSWAFSISPTTAAGDLLTNPKTIMSRKKEEFSIGDEDEQAEEFFSVGSCLTRCSSATNMDAFVSVKTNFSRCSSLNRLDKFNKFWGRRSIMLELCHCEGWPFGLCRKALFLPPLPKSPSESWTWRRNGRVVKLKS